MIVSINVRPGHSCRSRWPLQKASGGLPRLWPRVAFSPDKLPTARHENRTASCHQTRGGPTGWIEPFDTHLAQLLLVLRWPAFLAAAVLLEFGAVLRRYAFGILIDSLAPFEVPAHKGRDVHAIALHQLHHVTGEQLEPILERVPRHSYSLSHLDCREEEGPQIS